MTEAATFTANTEVVQVFFTNGAGTVYQLDHDMPHGGQLVMSRRDRAMAKAMLELALENVNGSGTP